MAKVVVHPPWSCLTKIGLFPAERKGDCIRTKIIYPDHWCKGEVYQRNTKKQKVRVSEQRLVPFLHKDSLLRTKPCILKCDVIVQVSELSSGKVSDEFETFIWVTLGLDVSYQCLKKRKNTTHKQTKKKSLKLKERHFNTTNT